MVTASMRHMITADMKEEFEERMLKDVATDKLNDAERETRYRVNKLSANEARAIAACYNLNTGRRTNNCMQTISSLYPNS